MKKLALFLALIAFPAQAQVAHVDVFRVVTGAQVMSFDSTVRTITNALANSQMSRVVCNADCLIAINASGLANTVSTITGLFLPADVPAVFKHSRNSKISVIGVDGTTGTVYVIELSK